MTDIAYRADRVKDVRILPYVVTFYKSLAFLLPCKYCRRSYQVYMCDLDANQYCQQRDLVRWVWAIKEKVNDKLDRPLATRLPYDKFQRRINTCTHCGHAEDVLDFLSILGLNYHPESEPLKKKHMLILHTVLPLVLPYPALNKVLERNTIKPGHLESQQAYLSWLYKVRTSYNKQNNLAALPPPQELFARYKNASVKNPLVPCNYVLDDPTTWTAEHAAKCFATKTNTII